MGSELPVIHETVAVVVQGREVAPHARGVVAVSARPGRQGRPQEIAVEGEEHDRGHGRTTDPRALDVHPAHDGGLEPVGDERGGHGQRAQPRPDPPGLVPVPAGGDGEQVLPRPEGGVHERVRAEHDHRHQDVPQGAPAQLAAGAAGEDVQADGNEHERAVDPTEPLGRCAHARSTSHSAGAMPPKRIDSSISYGVL